MLIPQKCKVCGYRLFEVGDTAREIVTIKRRGTDLHIYNLREIKTYMKEVGRNEWPAT